MGRGSIGYKTAANNCSQIKAKLRVERTAAIQHGLADRDAGRPSMRVDGTPS